MSTNEREHSTHKQAAAAAAAAAASAAWRKTTDRQVNDAVLVKVGSSQMMDETSEAFRPDSFRFASLSA